MACVNHFVELRRYHIAHAFQELCLLSGEYWHWVLSEGIYDPLVALRNVLKLSHVRITLQLGKALHVVLVEGICRFLWHFHILGIEFLMGAISLGGGAASVAPTSVVAAATATTSEAASERHV